MFKAEMNCPLMPPSRNIPKGLTQLFASFQFEQMNVSANSTGKNLHCIFRNLPVH